MFVDSHCHINFPDFANDLDGVLDRMAESKVEKALCVSVNLGTFPDVLKIATQYKNVYASVGIHPNEKRTTFETSVDDLCLLSDHKEVVAIGETGLDYFRAEKEGLEWQQERFRAHIKCAREVKKPLIIHTREAKVDTIKIMREERAGQIGGVMHCFTETYEMAQEAMDMGFMISFSGIVTFKNATQVKEVASRVPLEFILIETDSPYLAPVPHRGATNEPSYVRYVAEELSKIKNTDLNKIASTTTANFHKLFDV